MPPCATGAPTDDRPLPPAGQKLADPPPATAFPGFDGWWNEMQLRLGRVASGILAEAPASNLSPATATTWT